jgi:hypothetical protein
MSQGHTVQHAQCINDPQLGILAHTCVVKNTASDGLFNLFQGKSQLTTCNFQFRTGTILIYLTVVQHVNVMIKHDMMGQILGMCS